MKKMFLALLSLLVVSMFLVSCGPKEVTPEKTALAGQAIKGDTLIKPKALVSGCDCGMCCNFLMEGETKTYNIKGNSYKVTAQKFLYQTYAGGVRSVDFIVNGQSFTLLEGEGRPLPGAQGFSLTEILYQSYAGGVHSATFCIK